MESKHARGNEKRMRRRKKSFTEALKEKYCVADDEPTYGFIDLIVSPKRKGNSAELAHLHSVVLNEMDVTRADIPRQGLTNLCPNVVDLDLANNLLENWSELVTILSHLPKLKYVNVSCNKLRLEPTHAPSSTKLSVENLALNDTGVSIGEVVKMTELMPKLKELHLCGNNYDHLDDIDEWIRDGAFSTLECLRLNNNGLTSWSEVWKLRHLPHLKFLILSGNPVSGIFYQSEEKDNEKDSSSNNSVSGSSVQQPQNKDQVDQDLSTQKTNEAQQSEECNLFDLEDMSIMNLNSYCDELILDDFQNDDSLDGQEDEDEDKAHNDQDDIRPVSRFGRHTESDCSDDSSSDNCRGGSESDDMMSAHAYQTFDMSPPSCQGSVNANFNNSGRSGVQKSLYRDDDNFDGLASDLFGLFNTDPVFTENLEGDDVEDYDETEDWPRMAAEAFLYDIISSIDFDENTTYQTPSVQPSEPTYDTSDNTLTDSHMEANNSVENAEMSPSCTLLDDEPLNQNQNASTSDRPESQDTSKNRFSNDVLEVEEEDEEEQIFLVDPTHSTEHDAFTPRTFAMLDDQDLLAHWKNVSDPPKSKAQRCLFERFSLNKNIEKSTLRQEPNFSWDRENGSLYSRSESDSCSDCEAEQHQENKSGRVTRPDHTTVPSNLGAACLNPPIIHSSQQPSNSTSMDFSANPEISRLKTPGSKVAEISSTDFLGNVSERFKISTSLAVSDRGEPIGLESQPVSLNPRNSDGKTSFTGANVRLGEEKPPVIPDKEHISDDEKGSEPKPFQHLQMLCLSNANLSHWNHLKAFMSFPKLSNLRLKNNPLYSSVNPDDKRKLYIASLPKVSIFNGSEVTQTEREKAERHYLRYFMDKEEKPDFYHTLVQKHGPPVKLVDIDLAAGYQEWANLKFVCEGEEKFTRKIHLVDPVSKLRLMIAQAMGLPRRCFVLYHHSCGPSHPESERELVELRCESLPMSRFDFAEGDEIHIDIQG